MQEKPMLNKVSTWDGKLVLAGMFLIGYYGVVFLVGLRPLPAPNASVFHDAMLTLGPVIGIIFGKLFQTTAADERQAALRSADLQAAMSTPPVEPLKEAVRTGVADALSTAEPVDVRPVATGDRDPNDPLAADGQRRDWLDGPDADPWNHQ